MTFESSLIERARRFDEAALAEIYDRFSPGVYRYALRLLGEPLQAEDCVADTFLRYLQALRTHGGPQEHLQAYLYRIAHNWITDRYRRQPPPPLPLLEDLIIGEDDLCDNMIDAAERDQVRQALDQLTPDQRRVILLKYQQGFANETVAAVLNKPVGAIKSLHHRAINALKRVLLPNKEERYGTYE